MSCLSMGAFYKFLSFSLIPCFRQKIYTVIINFIMGRELLIFSFAKQLIHSKILSQKVIHFLQQETNSQYEIKYTKYRANLKSCISYHVYQISCYLPWSKTTIIYDSKKVYSLYHHWLQAFHVLQNLKQVFLKQWLHNNLQGLSYWMFGWKSFVR